MFKNLTTQIKHSLSNNVADWMQALRREEKLNLLMYRVGWGLLDILALQMDVRNTYVEVSGTGGVGFDLHKSSPNKKTLIATVPLWYATGIVEYIKSYYDESVNNYTFQKMHNAMTARVSINILNQVYGENYIKY